MNQILHIVKYKLLSFVKLETRYKAGDLVKNAGSFIVYGSFAVGAYLFSFEVVKYLIETLHIGLFLLHEFISITLFIFFVSVNVGNIVVSYSTLYKSGEVNFFFTKPIAAAKIFILKFLDNFFYSSSTLILILLAVLAGYSSYFEINFINIILLFCFNFLPFMLTAAALGIIILLLMLRLSIFIGPKLLIAIIALLYIVSLSLFFNIVSPVELVNEVMEYYPNIDGYFGDLIPESIKLLPNYWLAQSMYWLTRDVPAAAGKYFYLQVVSCSLLFFIALLLGKKWYRKTWFHDFTLRKRNSNNVSVFLSFENNSSLSPFTESVIKRELFTFIREPSQVFHSVVLMGLILIFLGSVSSLVNLGGLNYFMQTVIYLSVVIFNTFLISTLSLRFVFPLVSLEGNVFWKVKSAPVSIEKIIGKKLQPYFIIILLTAVALNLVVNIQFGNELLLLFTVNTFASAVTIVLINYSMGAVFAVYNEKNPIRIASSQGASLSFLLNIFYMIFLISILFMPVQTYFSSKFYTPRPEINPLILSTVGILLFSIIIYFTSKVVLKFALAKDY